MRIGFVSPDHLRDWHGTTRLIDLLATELSTRGHDIVLIAKGGRASSKIPVSARTYPHDLIEMDWEDTRGREAAARALRESGIDLCVASVGGKQILRLPSLLKGSAIPFVFADPHDPRVRTFADWQPYESYGALACTDAIQTLLPEYLEFYPAPLRSRVRKIGVPAPPPADVDFQVRRTKKAHTIIAVGRLNETMKRFSLLLRAFALLHEDFSDWNLKLVGDGPYWEFYHEMTRQLGIADHVEFTGALHDPAPHYQDADIFCSPSLIEGFGLVFGEAAAFALPLVGYHFCAPAASFVQPGMGMLARECTPQSLADALRALMQASPEERERMGVRAREAMQSRFRADKVYDAWEKLFWDVRKQTTETGETTLDRIWRNAVDNDAQPSDARLRHIGEEWEGFGPDSALWTETVLESAAAEITLRDDPMTAAEQTVLDREAENTRLRCELIRLRQDYSALAKKYEALQRQLHTSSGRRSRR